VKYLGRFHNESKAQELILLLESKGIPVYAVPFSIRWIGYLSTALHVYLDDQYPDACALLTDPEHQVRQPVDRATFEQLQATQWESTPLVKWSWIVVALAAAFFLASVLVVAGLAARFNH